MIQSLLNKKFLTKFINNNFFLYYFHFSYQSNLLKCILFNTLNPINYYYTNTIHTQYIHTHKHKRTCTNSKPKAKMN